MSIKLESAASAGVLQVPAWVELPWLRAGFSTRLGGVSPVYGEDELNLGWTREDDPQHVAENRRRFVATVADGASMELTTIRQTHTSIVRIVEKDHGPLVQPDGKAVLDGDGLMTDVPGLLLGVQTADCIPVLVADRNRKAVAAFHAGWRGTVARIVEHGISAMRVRYGSHPDDLVAAVGPGIGQCCYIVGAEVRSQFEDQFAYAPELFTEVGPGPEIHIDLWEANRRQLLDAGLPAENITVLGECTGCALEPNGGRRYFSHRMEQGYTGRMLSAIGVIAD